MAPAETDQLLHSMAAPHGQEKSLQQPALHGTAHDLLSQRFQGRAVTEPRASTLVSLN